MCAQNYIIDVFAHSLIFEAKTKCYTNLESSWNILEDEIAELNPDHI